MSEEDEQHTQVAQNDFYNALIGYGLEAQSLGRALSEHGLSSDETREAVKRRREAELHVMDLYRQATEGKP